MHRLQMGLEEISRKNDKLRIRSLWVRGVSATLCEPVCHLDDGVLRLHFLQSTHVFIFCFLCFSLQRNVSRDGICFEPEGLVRKGFWKLNGTIEVHDFNRHNWNEFI